MAADCAETFVIYAKKKKTIQQTPDDKSTPASNIRMEGGGAKRCKNRQAPAQTPQHWCVSTNPLGFFFGPIRPRYVNKEKKKKKKKRGEKAYIYTFVQKRHSDPRHYWCSVYTPRRESRLSRRHAVSSGRTFLYQNKKRRFHLRNTQRIRGAQKIYG